MYKASAKEDINKMPKTRDSKVKNLYIPQPAFYTSNFTLNVLLVRIYPAVVPQIKEGRDKVRTRQVYNGPHVVKFIAAIRK